MNNIEKIKKIMKQNKGMILTSDLEKAKIARQYLNILLKKGVIERISRGVYVQKEMIQDEFYCLQKRFKKGIFSNNTALYFHELTDRTPIKIDMTFQSNYRLNNKQIKCHYVNEKFYEIGKIKIKSPKGLDIYIYNIERTICDILSSKNKMDLQIVLDAIKMYAKRKDKNLILLSKYSKIFKVEKILKQYMEVLI